MAAKNRGKGRAAGSNGTSQQTNNGGRENNPSKETTRSYIQNQDDPKISMESPLKIFGEAKDRINSLYVRLDRCVNKASLFYSDAQLDQELTQNIDLDRLKRLTKSIETIRTVLSRNQMKVAFFGRTSNGKSTVINAILHDRVLPMGYGHTTGCFLQIQGCSDSEPFYEVQKNGQENERKPIQSVTHIANALNSGALEYSTLVKIFWPISKCPLLKYDVVLVDSPGVDVEENLDDWIDEHCHDADVFVLVSNAESTLNIAEKNFFHKVSEKLSKPNIFILNNRWDSIADDPDSMEQVKKQHVERAVNFLADELRISSPEEARQKTFFVSARETLQSRSQGAPSDPISRFGSDERTTEFQNFEKRFEESLSKSAVRTKFKKHTDKGRETIDELTTILNNTQLLVTTISEKKLLDLQHSETQFKSIQNVFYANENILKQQVIDIRRRLQVVFDTEFDNEIRRLSCLVDDFDMDFSPTYDKIPTYKEHLYQHVEENLSENLRTKIISAINKHVSPFNKTMLDLGQLVSQDRQRKISQTINSQSLIQDDWFDLKIYRQFYTDFQEDLEFRFSLGLFSIIRRFQSKRYIGKPNGNIEQIPNQASLKSDNDLLSMMERFMLSPPQSPTTVGSLAVGGILVRTVGWRVIIVTTVIYGALYAYEYLTWTNSAKERTFKSQYVKFARKGLHDCVPIISQHIANSIEQKIQHALNKVKTEIEMESSEVKAKISFCKSSLDKLLICDKFTSELLGENEVLLNELIAFAATFLSS